MSRNLVFPEGFLWGVGTSSYQVEGARDADGKGPSIWDTFSHLPGAVHHGDDGDVACDQYQRIAADIEMMAELGIPAYRFSIAWPRIQPDGGGRANAAGLDHYRRVVDLLRTWGIEPMVTLYHWDLPQALQDSGGWTNRDTAGRFEEYAGIVGAALADRVTLWTTLNEPWVAAFNGYARGIHAPGIRDLGAAVRASHHLLLGHGLAARALRAVIGASAQVGIALNMECIYPATTNPEDVAAARRVDAHLNRWFLDPVLKARYPEGLADECRKLAGEDFLREGDLEVIRADLDYLGVNYYKSRRVVAVPGAGKPGISPGPDDVDTYDEWLGVAEVPPGGRPVTTKGWTIDPEGLTELLVRIRADYGDVPLYITENGAAFPDYVDPAGAVKDPERVEYVRSHLAAVHAAIAQGVAVRGYILWSLLDNFEWADGYSQRFGIVYVDYKTQERIPKTSARWWHDVVAANAVEAAATDRE
jgi:beta-glucosidase